MSLGFSLYFSMSNPYQIQGCGAVSTACIHYGIKSYLILKSGVILHINRLRRVTCCLYCLNHTQITHSENSRPGQTTRFELKGCG